MFLYLVRPESSRIFRRKVYKWIGVVFRWFFPGVLRVVFTASVVFTEVRRRSRVLAEAVIILVTEVTSEVSTEVVFVTEKLLVSGRGRKWRRSSVVTSLA